MKPILFLTLLFSLNAEAQIETNRLQAIDPLPTVFPVSPGWAILDMAHEDSMRYARCHHIFITIQPDTLVWDKKPITINHYIGTLDSMVYNKHFSPPITQKIVCLLCHKQTEQKIKIINEQK